MLTQLLNLFFNKQDPNEWIFKRLDCKWQDWLAPISAEKSIGEDLTYHDTFQEIKEEINKLSAINYTTVISGSETILKYHSKDIRIATYYCLAKLHVDGVSGFADGLELLAGLLYKFGTTLYPSRSNIRKNSIEWLASSKFTEALVDFQPFDEVNLLQIIAALNLIEQSNKLLFSTDNLGQSAQQPDLTGLHLFFLNSLKIVEQTKSNQKVKDEYPDSVKNHNTDSFLKLNELTIHSQRDLLDQARRMVDFLRETPEGYLAAGRFLRVLRWDTVNHLPPIDNSGRTRLVAPRVELKHKINHLIAQEKWKELFDNVEGAFMENANHFWLDLQRAAVLALQKMGEPYQNWAEIYLTDIGLFLNRLQGIEHLTFENGTPFSDDETLMWITSVKEAQFVDDNSTLESSELSCEDNWNEIEKKAKDLLYHDGLEKTLIWLQSLDNARLPKQSYLLQYIQARIAEQNGKLDFALKLLTILDNKNNCLNLSAWEPVLIFDVKQNLLRLLKQKIQLKGVNKIEISDKIEHLSYELVQLDPVRALNLI